MGGRRTLKGLAHSYRKKHLIFPLFKFKESFSLKINNIKLQNLEKLQIFDENGQNLTKSKESRENIMKISLDVV